MRNLTRIVLGGLAGGLIAASPAGANTYLADCRGSAPGAGLAILNAAHALALANPGTDTIRVLGVCDLVATGFRINTPIELEGQGGGAIQRLNGSTIELRENSSGTRIHHLTVISGGFSTIRNRTTVVGANVVAEAQPDNIRIDHNLLISDSRLGGNNSPFASAPRNVRQITRDSAPQNDAGVCTNVGNMVGISENWEIDHNDMLATTGTPGDSGGASIVVSGNGMNIHHNSIRSDFVAVFGENLSNCAPGAGNAAFLQGLRRFQVNYNKIDVNSQPPDPAVPLGDRYPVGIVYFAGCPPTQSAYAPDYLCDAPRDGVITHNCVRVADRGAITCSDPNDPDPNCPLALPPCGSGPIAKGVAIGYLSQFAAGETTAHNKWTLPLSLAPRPIPACTFSGGNICLQSVGSDRMVVDQNTCLGAGICIFNTDASEGTHVGPNAWTRNDCRLGGASAEAFTGGPWGTWDPAGVSTYSKNKACTGYNYNHAALDATTGAPGFAENRGFCDNSQAPCDLGDVGPGFGSIEEVYATLDLTAKAPIRAPSATPRRDVGHKSEGKMIFDVPFGQDLSDAQTPDEPSSTSRGSSSGARAR